MKSRKQFKINHTDEDPLAQAIFSSQSLAGRVVRASGLGSENSDIYINQFEVFQRIIDSLAEGKWQPEAEGRWELEDDQRKSEAEAWEREIETKLEIEREKLAELEKQLEIEIMKKRF
ncbi:hypothetical protein AVEN_121917-1 [Araneus ventricosus]|uniref:Uncharacterized protein n=1 Tax=Araneus ventricosus TaxID=182803 RepID=A0A4Y2J6B2_ARAVE|nr:hypothetical protein AVEN_121917-1 [Araneus ventricosus]